ncbi:MAG: B-box zinc finger protein [Myxococcales bacterium]
MDEPQAPSHISGGARCALHDGQPFTAVCQRCGTYMCQTCTEGGKFMVCPSCRARTGLGSFPLRRDAFTWGQLTGHAWNAYKRNWALLLVVIVIVFVAFLAPQGLVFLVQFGFSDQLGMLFPLVGLLSIPLTLLQWLLTLGMLSISVKIARGEPATLGMLFGEWRKLGSMALQGLVFFAAVIPLILLFGLLFGLSMFGAAGSSDLGVVAALLSVPLGAALVFYAGFGAVFSTFELVAQPNVGGIDGIRNSWRVASGQRLAILLGGLIALGATLLGSLACGVGVLFAYGYCMVLFATVYLTLRNGADGLVA